MCNYSWRPFLERFSRLLLASDDIREPLSANVVAGGWMGYPPASEVQLCDLESRLGVRLPPSYREFLATSNGWRATGFAIYDLFSVDRVEWFRTLNLDWITIYEEGDLPPLSLEEHLVYGKEQDCVRFRVDCLRSCLQVSGVGDSAVYLLNPEVRTQEGEWEAWDFASWYPGAHRYRTFWDLMQCAEKSLLYITEHDAKQLRPGEPPEAVTQKLLGLKELLCDKRDSWVDVLQKSRQKRPDRHVEGIVNALDDAIRRVDEARRVASGPTAITRLLSLAKELEHQHRQLHVPRCDGGPDAGRSEGYREAAALIDWFLNGTR
jgi:hypothetical protein